MNLIFLNSKFKTSFYFNISDPFIVITFWFSLTVKSSTNSDSIYGKNIPVSNNDMSPYLKQGKSLWRCG